jgi:hypothetical protein
MNRHASVVGRRGGSLVALAATLLLLGCAGGNANAPRFAAPRPPPSPARLAVVGDLQRTAPILEAWRERNDAERARVVAAIAQERPDLLALTGDCVFDGGSDAQWAEFDELMAPLRAAGVPVVAALGNHEHWLGRDGASRIFARLPHLAGRFWYEVPFGPLRIVVLDSDEGALGARDWAAQRAWYEATLARLDADERVRGVLVVFHHPPLTNSTVTGDDAHVQTSLLPAFLHARKTMALLTGHVHTYERYLRDGKMLVVSGGGGGPRAALLVGDARRHADDLFAGPAVRDAHFTVYTVDDAGVHAEVRGLAKGGDAFRVMDRFELPWP